MAKLQIENNRNLIHLTNGYEYKWLLRYSRG